jgi:CTP-dependent riboflavin kinase
MSKPKPKKMQMIIEASDEPVESLDSMINGIDTVLNKLHEFSKSSNVNMTDVLNLHKSVNTGLDDASRKIEEIKKDFNSNKHKVAKDVDSKIFTKYMEEINKCYEEVDNEQDIEKAIQMYKSATQKISTCEQYLKLKQMNLVYCDNEDDV